MKGLELPVNTLIILVIAIIVLIGVIAFFMGVFGPSSEGVQLEAAKNIACQRFISLNCDDPDDVTNVTIDLNDNGQAGDGGDTLTLLCQKKYNNINCRELCNCPT